MAVARRLALLALVTAVTAAGPAFGANESAPSAQIGGQYFRLETASARYNVGTGAFSSDTHVHLTRDGLDLVADRGDGNTKTGTAFVRGNVKIVDSGGPASPQGKGAEPATLTCDQLDVDARADTYKATGHAHYESKTRKADADTMTFDRKRRKLHLEGNVTIVDSGSTAHANAVDADLKSGETVTSGAPVTVSQPVASPTP